MNRNKKLLNAKSLTLFLLQIFFAFNLSAKQIPTVTGIIKTNSYTVNPVVVGSAFASNTIQVVALPNALDYNIQNAIALKYDLTTDSFFLNQTILQVDVTVNRWDALNNPLPITTKTLTIIIDNKLNRVTLEQAILKLTNGYKVAVTINNIWLNGTLVQTLPKWVSVESEINMDRYFDFTLGAVTSPTLNGISPLDNDCDLFDDEIRINWTIPSSVPEEYQLEWTYVSSYSSTGGTYPPSAFFADFKNNSTRITTFDNSYKVSLLFDRGYIAFRVRAVGRDWLNPTKFIFGPWTSPDFINIGSLSLAQRFTITQEHEKFKNWQYATTYAEEGKKKEVINYFDGSLHNRQTVTKINSDKNVIVGETMYDFQGRPAVNVLPVPVVLNCTTATAEPVIKYYTKFNVDNAGTVYSKSDFDLDIVSCVASADPMDTVSGASRYYSNNNPDKTKQQAFLPHAKEYPFTQIEYTPDNTGRIRNQSGVGSDYKLGSGKETKYLYGQPNQLELDRMFGSETGDASHYKKNVVIDANGQSSVTYMNQEGKTIATALAGVPPTQGTTTVTRMDSLDYANKNQAKFTIDLFNKDALGNSILNTIPASNDQIDFSTQLLVPFKSAYEFKYELTVDTVHDACLRLPLPKICFQCVYDMSIEVKDECGVTLTSINKMAGNFIAGNPPIFTTTCTTGSSKFNDVETFTLVLKPGVYTVSKILKVNKDAKDFYVNKFLDSTYNKCFKTLSQFQAEELAKIDTSDCYNTCAKCVASLGKKDDYVSSGQGTDAQWDFLYQQCTDPCRYKSLCDVTYEMMLSDVSPGGQYGKFNAITYSAASEPISVYNVNNGLNPNIIFPFGDANWQKPRIILNGNIYKQYLDENGDRTRVIVTETAALVFIPPVFTSSLVFTDPNTLQKYTYPENLSNLADFIPIWDPGFAKSLVLYHPEYAYYVSCSDHAVKFPSDNRTSDNLDSLLLATETFTQAVTAGFINGTYNTINPALTKIKDIWFTPSGTLYDPFFTNATFEYSLTANPTTGSKTNLNMFTSPYNINLKTDMDFIVKNYRIIGTTPYTMADVAAIIARCGNNFGATPTATCLAFGRDYYPYVTALNDSVRNKEWNLFKQFYFSEKQKLQFKRMNFFAQHTADALSNYYGGCNACFGTSSYNPFVTKMIIPPTFSSPLSAFYDFSEPCCYATYSNYSGVTKRFYDPANTGLNTNVTPLIYQMTGQCPMAFQLQGFLNGMTSSSRLVTPTLSLNTVNEFNPDMYLAISGGINPPLFVNYTWSVTLNGGGMFTANFVDPTTNIAKCTLTLDITGTSITSFSNIIGVNQLMNDPSNGPNSFTAVAVYLTGTVTASAIIKGKTSCIDIQNCNFPPQCTPNQFASDIQTLLSYLQANSLLNSLVPINLSSSITTSIYLTPTIKNTLGTPNTNIFYKFIPGGKLMLYNSPGTNTIVLTITSVIPSGPLTFVVNFANMRSNYNNLFKMDGMDLFNVLIKSIEGRAEIITPTQTIGISMGECGLPEPPECSQKEHKVRKDLESLVKEILTTKPFNTYVDLFSLSSFSSLLKSYVSNTLTMTGSTYTNSLASNPNFDTLTISLSNPLLIDESGCKFKLFHYRNNGTILNFPNITNIASLTGIGTPDISGNYFNFKALATYTYGASTIKDTIYGISCWPIKNCDPCPPPIAQAAAQSKIDSAAVAAGKAFFDQNLVTYPVYKAAIDSVNIKSAWAVGTPNYVTASDYLTYADQGFIYASNQLVKFANNFDTIIDSKTLLRADSFIMNVGNLTNCNHEFKRYTKSVQVYNIKTSVSFPSYTLAPIMDSVFYKNHLCDSSFAYVKYLKQFPIGTGTPKTVLQFFNITNPNPVPTDSCKLLYNTYINIHKQFLLNPIVQTNCKQANIIHPLYSYDEIVKHNLCCSSQGLAAFTYYINSLATASINCPSALPDLNNCGALAALAVDPMTCQRYYSTLIGKINQYNLSPYAIANTFTLDPNIYPTFYSFQLAGYCDCVLNYINYLDTYINWMVGTILPLPKNIDEFPGCPHSFPPLTDSCKVIYGQYLSAVNAYNMFVQANPGLGYPIINVKYTQTEFSKSFCNCAAKFIAGLNAIVQGAIKPTPEQLKLMLDLPSNCDKPCSNKMDSAFVFPPYTKYDNPCVKQQINLALQNAANSYQQYIDSFTTYFADKYNRHCLGALENYTYKYDDKEYHVTLYYYDQAGNLIKTIPPEGMEPIAVTSYTDVIEQKIISDRTFNQQNIFTAHRMATKYIYNSLNQLILQSLPDHDNMDICDGNNPNGLDTGLVINSLQFVTPNKGYLCGYIRGTNFKRGLVYTSSDAGNSWTKINGVTSGDLQKVQFVSTTNGFAVSNFGMVFKTTDGGNNWDLLTSLYNPTSGARYDGQLYDLYFKTSLIGVVGGINSAASSGIYYTIDGGVTFKEASVTGAVIGDSITGFGYDGTTVIASAKNGIQGRLFKSTNNSNWNVISNFSANNLKKVQFINNNLAFAVGEEGTLLRSTLPITISSPPQWQVIPTSVVTTIRDIYFKNATDGVALIDSVVGKAKIWKTFNGGITWQNLSAPGDYYNSLELYDISQHKLIATGNKGLVAKILLTTSPFGIIKITTPSATTNFSYGDAILQPSGELLTAVVNPTADIVYSTYNSQIGAPLWFTAGTSTIGIPPADAKFAKVLVSETNVTTPDIQALLLTTTGKLYSYYRAYNAPAAVCSSVTVGGGFTGKFFNDITTGDQITASTFFAFDSINKRLYRIVFSGSSAASTLLNNTGGPGYITRNVNSIEVINSGNEIIIAGNTGHIQYGKNLGLPVVQWSDVTQSVTPTAINKVRSSVANNFIAFGIDGTVWKNPATNINDWYLRNSGTVVNLNSAAIDNFGVGLIAGNNGKLFKLTNGQTTNPILTNITATLVTANLTDVAIEPLGGTSAYVTASNGKVQYISNYNLPSLVFASSGASSSVNGVAYKAGNSAAVVGNNVYASNYFSTSSMITKNLFTRGLNSIHFYDPNNGFVIDSNDVIRRTTDGGLNWSVVLPDIGSPTLTRIFTTKANQSVLIGLNNFAKVINNNTMSFILSVGVPSPTDFYDINFNKNKSFGAIVGSKTRAAQIVPVGLTSFAITYIGQAISGPKLPPFFTVHVFENNSFITAGAQGKIYYSKAGIFYQQMNYTPPVGNAQNTVTFKDSYFHDDYTGYVVGDKGNAFKVILPDVISVIGVSTNSITWIPFCAQALNMAYTSTVQISNLDFTSIAFSNRTNGMIAGADNNVVISGLSPNRYARLIKDQSGYYSTRFWYDKLGRLIISQNTKQFNKKNPSNGVPQQAFSYTLYDQLGRITQVGEKYENNTVISPKFLTIFGSLVNGYYNNNAIDDSKMTTWITHTAGVRREVTQTYYDNQNILPIVYTQNNLRKRVATTTFEDVFDGNNLTYNHATHYTYDIHGNVTTLWQENAKVAVTGQNIKQIDYQFDLISGKVNKVIFSPGQVDQFIHRYTYDADNRITKVETGKDDINFDIDAKYFYYAHGPLARTEYGKDHVQGMDYAYTLQGWIKGVNSNSLKKAKDMGSDGDLTFVNPNANFARDVVGYSLNYYQGDYEAIDYLRWNTAASRFEAYTNNSDLFNNRNDLFNGNISAMVTSISKPDSTVLGVVNDPIALPIGNAYRYDQLNRIKRSTTATNVDTVANKWLLDGTTIGGLYRNTFTYDANGNIETQVKRDSLGSILDSLVYNYEKIGTNKVRNRLYHVNDKVNTPLIPGDIENQGAFSTTSVNISNNYGYDEIGNLARDRYEEIDTIRWMVTGKIKAIIRSTGSTKDNLYFDYDAQGNRIAKHVYTSANVWKNSTYYLRDAQGNVMSVYDKKIVGINMSYKLDEQHLYGSSRIGMFNPGLEIIGAVLNNDSSKIYLGLKHYEISNHLGNVLTVISDKKIQIANTATTTLVDHYVPNIVSAQDYYPFGSVTPGRSFTSMSYRYGFNGQEKDNEVSGSGNTNTAMHWEYDTRLGRRWNLDPKPKVWESQYATFSNNPIFFIDLDGDDVDVSKLYEKDKKGNLLHKDKVKSFEIFASTTEGKTFLLSYAQKGFKLKGEVVKDLNISAENEGENSKKGVDIKYQYAANDKATSPYTSPFVDAKSGRLSIQINLLKGLQNPKLGPKLSALDEVDAIVHESFLHGAKQTERYLAGERNRLNIMGPDHAESVFKTTPYSKYGATILYKLQSHELIKNLDKTNYTKDQLFNLIMNPGMGH